MKIYYLPLDSSGWKPADQQLMTFISPKRQDKIRKYMQVSSQRLSLYAALTARMGISLLTGIPASRLAFQADSGQKPVCISAPDADFNFSHTQNAILCCVSSKDPAGADIERLRAAPLKIMRRFYHPEETEYVTQGSEQEQSQRFFEIWTKKEAYSKQLGLGLNLSPESYNTLSPELSSCLLTWRQEDYLCSVCGRDLSSIEKIMLTEEDIQEFYLG